MEKGKMIATRDGFGDEIVEVGKENKNIYVVDVDIGKSCKTAKFMKALPEQYVNVGIAEQNGAALSAGLASTGKIPFVRDLCGVRLAENVRNDPTGDVLHQSQCQDRMLSTAALLRKRRRKPSGDRGSGRSAHHSEHNRYPAGDYVSARKLVRAAAETYGPMYLRFTRDAVPVIYDEDQEFTIGKAVRLRDGKDVAIIAIGDTVRLALDAARELESKGIGARVLDMHTLKPLDNEAVDACINDIGKIITVEDHNIINGLGSAVCERAAEAGKGKVVRIGIQDCFGQSAPYERLLAVNGITVENIVEKAMKGI